VSRRGKSGLHRAGWWVTPTRGDPRESATESRPPRRAGTRGGARVKGCGKSAPAPGVTRAARQTPPGARSRGRSGRAACAGVRGLPARACGWTAGGCRQRQPERDGRRRGFPRGPCHRTRLTGRLVRRLAAEAGNLPSVVLAATPPPRVRCRLHRTLGGRPLAGWQQPGQGTGGPDVLTGSDGMTELACHADRARAYAPTAVALASARSRVAGQWVDLGIGPVVPAPAARAVNTRGRWHARVAHPVTLAQPAVQAELANHHNHHPCTRCRAGPDSAAWAARERSTREGTSSCIDASRSTRVPAASTAVRASSLTYARGRLSSGRPVVHRWVSSPARASGWPRGLSR